VKNNNLLILISTKTAFSSLLANLLPDFSPNVMKIQNWLHKHHSFIWRYVWRVRRFAVKRVQDDVIMIHGCLTPARLSAAHRCWSKSPTSTICLPPFEQTVH